MKRSFNFPLCFYHLRKISKSFLVYSVNLDMANNFRSGISERVEDNKSWSQFLNKLSRNVEKLTVDLVFVDE